MPKLPAVEGRQVLAGLVALGFRVKRQRGSHARLEHDDGRVTTVPLHAGATLPKGTLRAILRNVGLDGQTFRRLL